MSPEAARAIEAMRAAGFRLTSDTGSYRLIRSFDSSQAQLYSLTGSTQTAADGLPVQGSGNLGNISDNSIKYDDVAIAALKLAQAILRDEATRLTTLNQFQKPSVESRPYG